MEKKLNSVPCESGKYSEQENFENEVNKLIQESNLTCGQIKGALLKVYQDFDLKGKHLINQMKVKEMLMDD